MTVGELIILIHKPIATYVDEIVKALHTNLCKDLIPAGKCKSPGDCHNKKKPDDLCKSCKCWLKELEKFHRAGGNPSWHKNCNSSKWSEDPWEVAKFFMSALGSNHDTVKDAESTDLATLLNVLKWMNDKVFLESTRVDIELLRKVCSEVSDIFQHASNQEVTDDVKAQSLIIATAILEDIQKKFPNMENKKCLEHIERLKKKGVANVESELQELLSQRHLLNEMKEGIKNIKVKRLSEKTAKEKYEQKQMKAEFALQRFIKITSAEFKKDVSEKNVGETVAEL